MGVRQVNHSSQRAVFLDRDGVINQAVVREGRPYPPADLNELTVPSDAPALLARLRAAGFRLLVVTNQPDVARGTTSREAVEAINAELRRRLPLDGLYACYHDGETCACRKPKPGLFLQAGSDFGIDLQASWAVGDRWRDVEAARRAGVRNIFIDHGYGEAFAASPPDFRVKSLAEAVATILREEP